MGYAQGDVEGAITVLTAPGKQIKKVVDEMEPSRASEEAFERGFYEGEYDVVAAPRVPLRHELELIRQAVQTKWPNVLVSFDRIADWVSEGAIDPISGEQMMGNSPLDPQKRAVLLINNGLFERHW